MKNDQISVMEFEHRSVSDCVATSVSVADSAIDGIFSLPIKVVRYKEKYRQDFVKLNRQWIEKYFALEPMDLHHLENPQQNILLQGGEIFFILVGERVVGTCAMVPHGPHEFELVKMAVCPESRGNGYGGLLMSSVIDWAMTRRARAIIILSNTILEPAIRLYQKYGAQIVRLGVHADYKRCNIELKIPLL